MATGERVEGTHVSNRMNLEEFSENIALTKQPSPELSPCLQAMWWAKKGDWEEAHSIAQEVHDSDGYWVHAYLHRVEGDLGNADPIHSSSAYVASHGSRTCYFCFR